MKLKVGDKVKVILKRTTDSKDFNGKIVTVRTIEGLPKNFNLEEPTEHGYITILEANKVSQSGLWPDEFELIENYEPTLDEAIQNAVRMLRSN